MAMKRTKKKGTLLMILGLLLIAAALFLTMYNILDEKRAGKSSQKILEEVKKNQISVNGDEDYIENPEIEMPVTEIDGENYIGILTIPSVRLELPVMSQWSYDRLRIAPCRYSGSAYTGHFVIAAHNYSTHFGVLNHVNIGDEVSFTDVEGHVFSYQVMSVEALQPTDVEDMLSDEWDLTLFTCTLSGQSRLTVRCMKNTEGSFKTK